MSKSNSWWFVYEEAVSEEGSMLMSGEDPEEIRKLFIVDVCGYDVKTLTSDEWNDLLDGVIVQPATSLKSIERWVRSGDH